MWPPEGWTLWRRRLWKSTVAARLQDFESQRVAQILGLFEALPAEIQQLARENYLLLQRNPQHPSLHFSLQQLVDDSIASNQLDRLRIHEPSSDSPEDNSLAGGISGAAVKLETA